MTVIQKWLRLMTVLCLLLAFTAAVPGCKKTEVKEQKERIVNVLVRPAEKKALKPFVETIGTLMPYDEVVVSAEVEGILRTMTADEGTVVSKGMLLAAIDETDYLLEVRRAEASLRQAEATRENTRLEMGRKLALFKEELITRQNFDDVATRLSLAEADLDKAKATLDIARERLKKTKISAPLSGVVKEKKASAGNFVRNGTSLFTIIRNNPLKLLFTVPEKEVAGLKQGRDLTFVVDAFPGREFQGKVSVIYPALQEQTRSLQVEAEVPNSERTLKPGLFCHITLYTGQEKETILVPVTSLIYDGEKVRIFVVEGDRVKERTVTTGSKYDEMMEIVSGLNAGDRVVTAGQQNLAEGTKVNVDR
ncbi:MAG: efflux RND transporter periplasmic adaptor subunit [Nitrospirales bacterium]|nr:efflux RND transporter periplasmic adaptor subunit [Nitrospirales bacterium]